MPELFVVKRPGTKGIIVLTFALSLVFLVLIVGLSIDGGMMYVSRVRLQSAADAAALAAARSLNTSLTRAAQLTDAQNAATSFFNANFPTNYLNTSGHSITTTMDYGTGSTLNTAAIKTVATAGAPAYFMRMLGYTTVPISVTGTASRRDINVIVLLDISASMTNIQPGTTSTACSLMITAAANFVRQFSNNRDTIGLVTFNDGSTTYAPTTNFNPSIINTINGLSCTGDTNTAQGLHAAYAALQALNNPTKLNVVVLFTDGWAEALTADYPVKMLTDTRYGDYANAYGGNGNYPNYSSLYSMPPTTCKDNQGRSYGTTGWSPFKVGDPGAGATNNTIRGVLAENAYDTHGPDSTGWISGPWQWTTSAGQGWVEVTGLPASCWMSTPGYLPWSGTMEFRRDIAYIPSQDIYGNGTVGYRTDYNATQGRYITGQDKFPSGPYQGQLRPDQPVTLYNAGFNAAEHQGITIRNDTSLNPMLLTIGLGGNDTYPADAEFLIRLANVPGGTDPLGHQITNGIYDSTKTQGLYVYAPNSGQLAAAFSKVASFVTELSQ